MKITRENYEAYFLDYHEGNLTKGQKAQLMEFLAQNPSLKEEFEAFEMVVLEEETTPLPFDRDLLKIPVSDSDPATISEKKIIAYHEGDLGTEEKKQVLKAVAESPEARKAFTLYSLSKLEADTSIVFPAKASLKKHVIGARALMIRRLAVAAALLTFMVSLYFLLPGSLHLQQVAEEQIPAATPEQKEETAHRAPVEEMPVLAETLPEIQPLKTILSAIEASPQETTLQPARMDVSQLAFMNPKETINLNIRDQQPQTIEIREDFYWFTYAGNIDMANEEEDELPLPQGMEEQRYTSLASLAYSGIERRTGVDFKNMENPFTDRNFGLWDIAGMGLAGISHITGTSLTVDKETDETGRITSLGIGERFKISR
ncbi:MAG: hypothetical protein EA361_10800 [Bacteroidetes bacterium]|nr:MAG: hypothetical protein EA361_10800 [Bacteroidota bacterium]